MKNMHHKNIGNGRVEVEWDYSCPYDSCFGEQKDWNQTLVTKINQISAHRHQYYANKKGLRGDVPLVVPIKFRKLITEHEYYNKETKVLSHRYRVVFIENNNDVIELDGYKVRILNFVEEKINLIKNGKMERKYKLLVIGHMRHGKDTVAEMIEEQTGMSFKSSSEMAAEIFIYDELKVKYGYTSFLECFEDRMQHRAEWHDLIKNYNNPDKAKLAKEILKHNDMYVGMRSQAEIDKCIKDDIFDLIIGVYDPSKPLEPKDSFDIDLFSSSDIIIPTGDLETVREKVRKFCEYLYTKENEPA